MIILFFHSFHLTPLDFNATFPKARVDVGTVFPECYRQIGHGHLTLHRESL